MQQATFDISSYDYVAFKKQVLSWAHQQSKVLCYLDSNQYKLDKYSKYDCLLAVGVQRALNMKQTEGAWETLEQFCTPSDWYFGHLNYDLKNELEALSSSNEDSLDCPELYFFVPRTVFVFFDENTLQIHSSAAKPTRLFDQISSFQSERTAQAYDIQLQSKITQQNYLQSIEKIKKYIEDGEVYELNFCQEFFKEGIEIAPLSLFNKLNTIAKAPFSAYYSIQDFYLMCGSPERFLCKRGDTIISQPIKGTIARGNDALSDKAQKIMLSSSTKDKAENVMIVDLVRNDLAKSCKSGSVQVEELCAIYAFETVFQMISTVKGTLRSNNNWMDALKNAFPMGSMTGAPKVRSMQLIEALEHSKRGLYSGAVGYICPQKDFDFNVVIRSMQYNAQKQYLSVQVGGAIVYDSVAAEEYKECLLKAATMQQALSVQSTEKS